jgi:hypothetical protein
MEKRLESLKRMRLSAMMLQVGFTGENLSEFIQCQAELEALAERLQAEHEDFVTPQQCDEAKGSMDAFVTLIDQAQEKLTRLGNNSPGPAKRKAPTLG